MNQNTKLPYDPIYHEIFNKLDDAIIIFKKDEFLECNSKTIKLLALENIADIKDINPFDITPTHQPDGMLSYLKYEEKLLECAIKNSVKFEWLFISKNNEEIFVEIILKKHIIDDEEIFVAKIRELNEVKEFEQEIKKRDILIVQKSNYINQINDILDKNNIDENTYLDTLFLLNEYKIAIDESSIVSKANKKGIITYVNDKFCEITGYKEEELIGKNHNIIRHPDMSKEFFANLWSTILRKEVFRSVITNKRKDGTAYYVNTTIVPIVDTNDEIVEFIAIRQDITQIYEQEKIIKEQYIDPLTQIYNRQKLLKDLEKAKDPKVAVIDINNFNNINDFYGFETGDIVLQKFAQFLLSYRGKNVIVNRITNDVFAIFTYEKSSLKDFKELCHKIIDDISSFKIKVENQVFILKITIGVANKIETISTNILTMAKLALRTAKNKNKSIIFLDENINIYAKLQENKELIKVLRNALLNDNLLVYGQKIVDNKTDVFKYEVLMRIKLDDGTILSPFKFLEEAKKSKNYLAMTKILVTKTCEYFKDKDIEFSINLTIEDLKDTYTKDYIFETIIKTKTASRITFEIVESEGIEEFEEVTNFITKARLLNCKVAIDDFGTGYSNFEYLIKLNVDYIKIDGSLIKNMTKDENVKLTVQTIVNFAKALNIKTVAEFVYNDEVYEAVKSMQIDYSQGFFLHEPEYLT